MKLEFKIPTWLFILIIAIIAFIILYRLFTCDTYEGYVNYESSASSLNQTITIPMSDNSTPGALKVYDNIFYYPGSGKVVRVYDNGGSGSNIELITLYNRINGNATDIQYDENTTFNASGQIPPYYQKWDSGESNSNYTSITNNEFNYVGIGKDTYIHVVDKTITDDAPNHFGYYFKSDGGNSSLEFPGYTDISYVESSSDFTPAFVEDISFNTSAGTVVSVPESKIYQINENVYFNTNNGDLYIQTSVGTEGSGNTYDMFSRKGSVISTVSTSGIEVIDNYLGLIKKDVLGGNLVVYIANQQKTTIVLLKKNNTGQTYSNKTTVRFDASGQIYDSVATDPTVTVDVKLNDSQETSEETTQTTPDHTHNMSELADVSNSISDYYKWYWYWNTSGSLPVHFSEDYMLKTQVVPPVCPACPSCPKHEGCSNCGGNGGGGTVDACGNSVVTNKTTGADAANNVVNTAGGLANNIVDSTTDLLKSAGSGTRDLIGDTLGMAGAGVSGAADLVRDGATGAANMATDTVTGATGLATDAVTGTVNLARDFGEGTYDVINKGMDNRQGRIDNRAARIEGRYGGQMGGYGGQMGGYGNQMGGYGGPMGQGATNPYTYNGQLQQKPESNFLPLTADFSAFAK